MLARHLIGEDRRPARAIGCEGDARGAGADLRPPGVSIAGVQHHQPRILHPTIRVLEGPTIAALQGAPACVPAEVDARAGWQRAARTQVVVQKKAQPDHPPGAEPRVMREHEAHRPDDVRGVAQEHRALAQRLAHEPDVAVLQVAKPAVDQLGAGRRGVRGEIVLLAQQHVEPAPCRVPGDAGAVDAAADDEQVDRVRRGTPHVHSSGAIPWTPEISGTAHASGPHARLWQIVRPSPMGSMTMVTRSSPLIFLFRASTTAPDSCQRSGSAIRPM